MTLPNRQIIIPRHLPLPHQGGGVLPSSQTSQPPQGVIARAWPLGGTSRTHGASAQGEGSRAEQAASPPGLVHSVTSGLSPCDRAEILRKRRVCRMRRATLTAARAYTQELEKGGFRMRPVMVTLTYRDPDAWQPRHLSDCLTKARRHMERRGHHLVYEWVSEIQEKRYERTGDAVVHWHVIVWLPDGVQLPMFDKAGWWIHGMTNVEACRNAVGYAAKYASKLGEAALFPRGLRLHGRGGMGPCVAREVRYWVAPRYVREAFGPGADPVRAKGGGWIDRVSGTFCDAVESWRGYG